MQDKEALEAAVRAFEDWEFRVLEKESGVDDDEESTAEEHGTDVEIEKEIRSQQLLVDASQVNNIPYTYLTLGCRVCKCVWSLPVILLRDIVVEDGLMDKCQ